MSSRLITSLAAEPQSNVIRRAPWVSPHVIVSDLGDAQANTIIPGGDGSTPSYGPYGS